MYNPSNSNTNLSAMDYTDYDTDYITDYEPPDPPPLPASIPRPGTAGNGSTTNHAPLNRSRTPSRMNLSNAPFLSSSPPQDDYSQHHLSPHSPSDPSQLPLLDPRRFTPTLHASLVAEILSLRRDLEQKTLTIESLEETLTSTTTEQTQATKDLSRENRDLKRQLSQLESHAFDTIVVERDEALRESAELKRMVERLGRMRREKEEEVRRLEGIAQRDREKHEEVKRGLERRVAIAEGRLKNVLEELEASQTAAAGKRGSVGSIRTIGTIGEEGEDMGSPTAESVASPRQPFRRRPSTREGRRSDAPGSPDRGGFRPTSFLLTDEDSRYPMFQEQQAEAGVGKSLADELDFGSEDDWDAQTEDEGATTPREWERADAVKSPEDTDGELGMPLQGLLVESAVQTEDKEVERLEERVAELEERVAELEELLARRDKELQDQSTELKTARENALEVKKRDEELTQLDSELKVRESKLSDAQADVQERERKITESKKAVEEQSQANLRVQAHLEGMRRHLDEQEQEQRSVKAALEDWEKCLKAEEEEHRSRVSQLSKLLEKQPEVEEHHEEEHEEQKVEEFQLPVMRDVETVEVACQTDEVELAVKTEPVDAESRQEAVVPVKETASMGCQTDDMEVQSSPAPAPISDKEYVEIGVQTDGVPRRTKTMPERPQSIEVGVQTIPSPEPELTLTVEAGVQTLPQHQQVEHSFYLPAGPSTGLPHTRAGLLEKGVQTAICPGVEAAVQTTICPVRETAVQTTIEDGRDDADKSDLAVTRGSSAPTVCEVGVQASVETCLVDSMTETIAEATIVVETIDTATDAFTLPIMMTESSMQTDPELKEKKIPAPIIPHLIPKINIIPPPPPTPPPPPPPPTYTSSATQTVNSGYVTRTMQTEGIRVDPRKLPQKLQQIASENALLDSPPKVKSRRSNILDSPISTPISSRKMEPTVFSSPIAMNRNEISILDSPMQTPIGTPTSRSPSGLLGKKISKEQLLESAGPPPSLPRRSSKRKATLPPLCTSPLVSRPTTVLEEPRSRCTSPISSLAETNATSLQTPITSAGYGGYNRDLMTPSPTGRRSVRSMRSVLTSAFDGVSSDDESFLNLQHEAEASEDGYKTALSAPTRPRRRTDDERDSDDDNLRSKSSKEAPSLATTNGSGVAGGPPFPVPTRLSSKKTGVSGYQAYRRQDSTGAAGYGRPDASARPNRKRDSSVRRSRSASQMARMANRAISPSQSIASSGGRDSPSLPPLPTDEVMSPIVSRHRDVVRDTNPTPAFSKHRQPAPSNSAPEPAADPTVQSQTTVVQAITETMVGEWMWKYVRRRRSFGVGTDLSGNESRGTEGGAEGSGQRHKRWVWLAPYERAVMWSSRQPKDGNAAMGKSGRKLSIQSVLDVKDDTPLPKAALQNGAQAFGRSILILTPARALKFTAPTKERHYIWLTALSFLSHSGSGDGLLALPPVVHGPDRDHIQQAGYGGRLGAAGAGYRGSIDDFDAAIPPPIQTQRETGYGVRDSIRVAKSKFSIGTSALSKQDSHVHSVRDARSPSPFSNSSLSSFNPGPKRNNQQRPASPESFYGPPPIAMHRPGVHQNHPNNPRNHRREPSELSFADSVAPPPISRDRYGGPNHMRKRSNTNARPAPRRSISGSTAFSAIPPHVQPSFDSHFVGGKRGSVTLEDSPFFSSLSAAAGGAGTANSFMSRRDSRRDSYFREPGTGGIGLVGNAVGPSNASILSGVSGYSGWSGVSDAVKPVGTMRMEAFIESSAGGFGFGVPSGRATPQGRRGRKDSLASIKAGRGRRDSNFSRRGGVEEVFGGGWGGDGYSVTTTVSGGDGSSWR